VRALRAVHAGFYLSAQTISVGLVGPGNVGKAFVRQLAAARERLRRDANVDLRLRGIASSRAMWVGESTVEPLRALAAFGDAPVALDLEHFADHVRADHLPHAVILDCSASGAIADRYASWLARGIHVAVANKQAGAGSIERYAAIRAAARDGGAHWRYEATVGAGLPILGTLRDLVDTGDEIHAVEGILSGTLAWLFNEYDGGEPFSALVRRAKEKGYTEPDPRDDLSGLDVARKLVILAREIGWSTRLEDVAVEGLVPAALTHVGVAEFLDRLPELDGAIGARFEAARAKGHVLRYVARVGADGTARVGIAELPGDHAFAHGRLTDNVVQFTTARYRDNPLVVQGPGAGPEVTAAGVFADLLRIASSVGSRP
jgi:aspartokinase/homoserine dehydrogenase 1